jgi:hypothetical protein
LSYVPPRLARQKDQFPLRRRLSSVQLAELRESDVKHALLLREVNQRIAELGYSGELILLCECGNAECLAQIQISRQAYESLRRSNGRFIVASSHSASEVL